MKTYFVDKLQENAKAYPDRPALELDFHSETVTYAELWERSGRVYAGLKAAGIGREDVVLLLLPRHPMMLIALLGVMRAGAAALMCEDSYPAERVEVMKADCGAKLVLNRAFFENSMDCPPLSGREPLHLHDALFVFYTSGTTGKPKGILHEYGKLDIGIAGTITDEGAVDFEGCGRFAFVPPFNFSATMIHGLPELYKANTLYILSYAVSKNFRKLRELLEKEQITELFLSPSVLRSYHEGFAGVKAVMTGSEPASRLSVPGLPVTVHYAMTESLYCVSKYCLKEPCENAPVASAETSGNIFLLDEEGNPVKNGETGEICFPDPYFRGYIGLPEKTREVYRDGLFHSGDLGFRDEKGDVFIKGRSDDMIKINGNRLEPGEVEGAAREISGLENVAAKGFCDARRSYVALYYLSREAGEDCVFRNPALARKKLSEKLPDYMIPSYFVPLEAFPLNANGKFSRKLLPEPAFTPVAGMQREPANETERTICAVMAQVLSLPSLPPEQDFYEAGGDSISAIRVVSACSDQGLSFTASELLEHRSPAALTRLLAGRESLSPEKLTARENSARTRPQPLLAGQEIYRQLFEAYPRHPSICVPVIAILKPDVDLNRLKQAADKVIVHHPALLSSFRREKDGSYTQFYDETAFLPTSIEDMTEEELEAESRRFLQPVDLTRDRLYTLRLIRTPEKALFFFSVHHIVGDGTSNALLLNQIAECCRNPEAVLPPDCYYTLCEEEAGEAAAALKKEAAERNRQRLEQLQTENAAVLKPDLPGPDAGSETCFLPGVLPKSAGLRNCVFIGACLMTMAELNGCDSAMVYSAWHGRDKRLKQDSAGCFTALLPVSLTGISQLGRKELLSQVQEQLDFGTVHSVYSAITESGLPTEKTVIFNYQYGTMDFGAFKDLTSFITMMQRDKNQPNCLFNVGILDRADSDRLDFYCNFPRGLYRKETAERFGQLFVKAVLFLTENE